MVWDTMVSYTCSSTYIAQDSESARAVAELAEGRKQRKCEPLKDRVDFRPFRLDILGCFGPRAIMLQNEMAARIRARLSRC